MAFGLAGFAFAALAVTDPGDSFIQAGNNFSLDHSRQTSNTEAASFGVSAHNGVRIQKLFSPDRIDAVNRFKFVNTLCFKGGWDIKFRPYFIRLVPCYYVNGLVEYVPRMSADSYTGIYLDDQIMALDSNFEGIKYSLHYFVPPSDNALRMMGSMLTPKIINGWSRLYMPRFSIGTKIDLDSDLNAMWGISDFSE